MRIGVNGRFLAARPTGVQRVAVELVARLADRTELTLRVPRGCPVPDRLRAAARVAEGRLAGRIWEHVELPARADSHGVELDPANAGPLRGARRVLILHDVLPLSHPGLYAPAFRTWFRLVVARAARRAAGVVMFSAWARDEAVSRLELDPARVTLISQGVEPFDAPASEDDVRRTLDRFQLRRPFILAAGDGDPRKNTAFLEAVVRELDAGEDGARPTLVLVGAPYGHVQATGAGGHRQPAGGDAADAVRRLGHVTDAELRALYTAARVFCFPSLAEGFGRPPLEAMACGCPVVAADYGSAREVLGDAARIVPLDPRAWRDALRTLLDDDAAADRAAGAGRRHAARYRWDAAADGLLEACRRAAGDGAGDGAVTAAAEG